MACSRHNNFYHINCHKDLSDKDRSEGSAEGCPSGAIRESGWDTSFCTFAGQGHCSYVCGCNVVNRCFEDCGSHVYPSSGARVYFNYSINKGNLIKASDFNGIVSRLNWALRVENLNWHQIGLRFEGGSREIIKANKLSKIINNYNQVFEHDWGISGCNPRYSSYPEVSEFAQEGNIIKANDWKDVMKHILYLSTCCHCVSDYKLVCPSVCNCSCYY